MKVTRVIIIILGAVFLAGLVICAKVSAKIDNLETVNNCLTDGVRVKEVRSGFFPAKDFRGGQLVLFERNSDLKRATDTVSFRLIENTENPKWSLIKFDKPVNSDADRVFVLLNGKQIVITDIQTEITERYDMFSNSLECRIASYKINGKAGNGEFEFD